MSEIALGLAFSSWVLDPGVDKFPRALLWLHLQDIFEPGELPLFDELRDVADAVEGFTELSICDSLLLHLKHRDVHDLADCGTVEPLELPLAFGGQSPGLCSPEGSLQWWLEMQQLLEVLGDVLVPPNVD